MCLSGDVHVSIATELFRDPTRLATSRSAWSSSHRASRRRTSTTRWGGRRARRRRPQSEALATEALPHWLWVDLDSHGYVVIDVTPERVTAEWWHSDTVLERTTKESAAASFFTEHGSRRLTRVS